MHISSLDVDANSMANRRINSPSSQDMASNGKCIAILKTGEKKGQMCGATAKFGSPTLIYCGRHNGYLGGDTPSSGGHTPPPGPGRSATPSQISQPTPTRYIPEDSATSAGPSTSRGTESEARMRELVHELADMLGRVGMDSLTVKASKK